MHSDTLGSAWFSVTQVGAVISGLCTLSLPVLIRIATPEKSRVLFH